MNQETIDTIKEWHSGLTDHNAVPKALLITGEMGTGKSTLARAIVETLGQPYFQIPAHFQGRTHNLIKSRIVTFDLNNVNPSASESDYIIQLMHDDLGGQIEDDDKIPTNRFAVILLAIDGGKFPADLKARCLTIQPPEFEFMLHSEISNQRLKEELLPILIG